MDFSLHARDPHDGSWIEERLTGSATYKVKDSGVLVILDGKGRRRTYAPSSWSMIEEAAPIPMGPVGTGIPSSIPDF